MSAIGSLSTALTALRRNPILPLGGLLFSLWSVSFLLFDVYADSALGLLVWPISILATPFVLAGFVTMIHEALAGSTSLGAFVRGGTENYASMLGATVLLFVVFAAVSVVGAILVLIVGVGAVAADAGVGVLAVASVITAVVVGVTFVFVQFYDAAIVVSGTDAVGSFTHSVRLVSRNLVSVFGFSIPFFVLNWLGQGPGTVLYVLAIETTETGGTVVASESMLLSSVGVMLVLGTLTMTYAYTYFVAFYSSLVGDDPVCAVQHESIDPRNA